MMRNRAVAVILVLALAGIQASPASSQDPASGTSGAGAAAKKIIVLGYDGMDYSLTKQLMAEGRMPNFSRLAEEGLFSPLGTAVPPQSPVAWSNFITGSDAGGHGIFDFIHRDPQTMVPYLSTSKTEDAEKSFKIGKYKIPLSSGSVELLRMGKAFWEVLEEHGIETTMIRIPANFPPSGTATREISGMGTPDILGTYGSFSYFTSDASPFADKDISGGHVYEVQVHDHVVEARLYGPDNPFLVETKAVESPFTVYVDPEVDAVKIAAGKHEVVLEVGEWSEWIPVEFPLIPTQTLHGIVRFYMKSVRPDFQLYVTPVNIDPLNAALPISTPASFAGELAKATGYYYTQGMPEDTKALTSGILTRAEFLSQAEIAGREFVEQYKYMLDRWDKGLLFYYFGNLDQICHMLWRGMDPGHPLYDAEKDAPFADVIPSIYAELDALVGYTLERIDPETTLIVMSDHGFTSWRRAFHMNAWLRDNGYLAVRDPDLTDDLGFLTNVDWRRTKAYSLGINAVYLNLRGRERSGTVRASEREALLEEIKTKLLAIIDPATGKPAITKVYLRDEVFEAGEGMEVGPDMLIGYAKMTRGSNESAMGEIPPEVLTDNDSEWSGDHCMDHETVPGILLTNRPLEMRATDLKDLGASILEELGISTENLEMAVHR